MKWRDADGFLGALRGSNNMPKPAKRDRPGFIYFIAEVGEDGDHIAIKIGYAGQANRRKRTLQTGNSKPLVELARVPGTENEERRLHRFLAAHRKRGEFFEPDPPVYAVMQACVEFGGVPPTLDEGVTSINVYSVNTRRRDERGEQSGPFGPGEPERGGATDPEGRGPDGGASGSGSGGGGPATG